MEKIYFDAMGMPTKALFKEDNYYRLCGYTDKESNFVSILGKENATDLIVIVENKAIIGLFSMDENKLQELADFIEATVTKSQGIHTAEPNFLESLLTVCDRNKYPLVHHAATYSSESSLFQNFMMSLHEKRSVPKELLKRMEEHSVSVEKTEKVLEAEMNVIFPEKPEEVYEDSQPIILPAKSLPEGWNWCSYPDEACGSLKAPDGKAYFSYDLATYANQGGIEYKREKDTAWNIHWGSLKEFKEQAESIIKEQLDFTLGDVYLSDIICDMERNAWNGKEPRKACILAGEHVIEIEGYVYEQSYEDFTADSSISFDGTLLYEKDSRCIGSYRYETYNKGSCKNHAEAIAFIKEQTKGLEYEVVSAGKESLEDKIQDAGELISNGQKEVAANPHVPEKNTIDREEER